MIRRYVFKNLLNARDLGGYSSSYGGHTQPKRFIRTAGTDSLTPEEISEIINLGVTDVIDLRGDSELELRPSSLASCPELNYQNISISTGDDFMGTSNEEADFGRTYFRIAENHEKMQKVMKTLVHAKGATLFHCTAGKDRTGLTAALLLMLAGVNRDDIVADYMVSGWYIRSLRENFTAAENDAMPAHFMYSKPEYILTFFNSFDAKYSCVEQYLTALGLDEHEITTLRDKLLKP